jgi:hypothetical protein
MHMTFHHWICSSDLVTRLRRAAFQFGMRASFAIKWSNRAPPRIGASLVSFGCHEIKAKPSCPASGRASLPAEVKPGPRRLLSFCCFLPAMRTGIKRDPQSHRLLPQRRYGALELPCNLRGRDLPSRKGLEFSNMFFTPCATLDLLFAFFCHHWSLSCLGLRPYVDKRKAIARYCGWFVAICFM